VDSSKTAQVVSGGGGTRLNQHGNIAHVVLSAHRSEHFRSH
jgi:hypothetical protein